MDCLVGGVRRRFCNIFEISFAIWFLSILFLIFESEERASNKSEAKYGQKSSSVRSCRSFPCVAPRRNELCRQYFRIAPKRRFGFANPFVLKKTHPPAIASDRSLPALFDFKAAFRVGHALNGLLPTRCSDSRI